ncbi:hypothetical protein NC651_028114 [Populus alba x Populus x berolinensis]|nr:hypothetical protein NC651_028114 [Populus alba x Populus x berolinensis]
MHPNWGPEKNFTVKKGQVKVLSFRLSKITQDSRKRNLSLGYRFSFLFIVLASWHSQEFLHHFYIFSVTKKDEISGFHKFESWKESFIFLFVINYILTRFIASPFRFLRKLRNIPENKDFEILNQIREVLSCEKAADNQARSPINLHL